MTTLVRQDGSAWVSSSASTILPAYPTAAADGTASANDQLYMYLHAKPDSTTITPSGSWTHVATVTGGSGSVGDGTGPTKFAVYKRTVPGGGLTTTTTVNVSGQSVVQGCMVQYRPGATATFVDQVVNASIASGTSLAATAGSSTTVVDGDIIGLFVGAAEDAATANTPSTVAASGATFGSITATPGTTTSSLGNEITTFGGYVECTAGSSSSTLSTTGTGTGTSTRQVIWHVVSVGGDSVATNASAENVSFSMSAQDATVTIQEGNAQAAVASVALAANTASTKIRVQSGAPVVLPDPLAEYSFDEASGPALDVSGNGHDLVLGGDVVRSVSGHTGSGLATAGDGDWAEIAPAFGQTTDRTLALWMIDPEDAVVQWIVRWNVDSIDSGSWGFLNLAGDIVVQARHAGGFTRVGTPRPTDGLWHHYAATYDESTTTLKFYLDGVETESSSSAPGPLRTDADTIDIGAWTSTTTIIDDLRMYDSALDAETIALIAATPVGTPPASATHLAEFTFGALDASVSIKASAGLALFQFVNTNVVPRVPITCANFETTVTVDQHFCTVDLDFHEGSITLDAHAGEVGVEAHYGEVVVCGRE